MANILLNLRKNYGIGSKDINKLLTVLRELELMKEGDNVNVDLPEKDQASELALVLMWCKFRKVKDIKCNKVLNYSETSAKYFDERHFFDRLFHKPNTIFSKSIPFHFSTFNLKDDEDEIANKISNLTKQSIGHLPLASETMIQIQELVSNAFHHSKANIDVGCVSRFNTNGTFEFYIADQGNGIRKSFSRNKAIWDKYAELNDTEIIEKSTEKYVTCNPRESPQYQHSNSGIGLYFLKEFSTLQNGHLVIISGRGYYYIDKKKVKKKTLTNPWPGTVVAFKANLSQFTKEFELIKIKYLEDFDKLTIK